MITRSRNGRRLGGLAVAGLISLTALAGASPVRADEEYPPRSSCHVFSTDGELFIGTRRNPVTGGLSAPQGTGVYRR